MGQCYGFFEIPSVTAAIDAVDIMCKTADVEMITWEKKLGGRLVTIIIRGDVSAVTQAIEAAAANGIKEPVCYTVIPSPHEEIIKLINKSVNRIRLGGSPYGRGKETGRAGKCKDNCKACRKKENNCSQSAGQNVQRVRKSAKKAEQAETKVELKGERRMAQEALGMVETRGLVASIEAADTMLKSLQT